MADCITTIQPAHPLTGLVDRIRAANARVRTRRQEREGLRQLLELDDHALRDIGVTRGDVAYAARLPASENPSRALCKLSKRGDQW